MASAMNDTGKVPMAAVNYPPCPTSEQLATNARIEWTDSSGNRRSGRACWYPQMGGYVGKCVVEDNGNDGCFEAFVWHDGEFPFDDSSSPARLHHCDPDQFVVFGELVRKFIEEGNR